MEDGQLDARGSASVDVRTACERDEQVGGERLVRRDFSRQGELVAEVLGRPDADSAKGAGSGDRSGEAAAGDPTAHAGLDDRMLQSQLIGQRHVGGL